MPTLPALLAAALLLALSGCTNNVAGAFRRGGDGGGGGDGDATNVQAVTPGATVVDGRPRVRGAFPKGAGWPQSVPIVVVFNESVNEDSVAPAANSGGQPNVFVRATGTTQALPATFDFLLGGTAVLIRPLQPLPSANEASYEVVVLPDARDLDGVRFGGDAEGTIVATFTPDQDTGEVDGRIVTVLPENARSDQQRETPVYVVFDKPAVAASLTSSSLQVRPAGATPLGGQLSFPLNAAQVADTRVVRFTAAALLPGDATLEVVVTNAIRFGEEGVLEFNNRTPFSTFRTLGASSPLGVAVGNPSPGFPDKVNRNNVQTLQLDVALDASAAAGDDVVARLYGLDPRTRAQADVNFVERGVTLATGGAQTATISFADALGTVAAPRFADGAITLGAQLRRGTRQTGFTVSSSANAPRLDVTPPTLATAGPPAGPAAGDLVTDQEYVVFHGTASEQVAAGTFTLGSASEPLFAGQGGGRFAFRPVLLGRLTAPVDYSVALVDAAGNAGTAVATGRVFQRGSVTGALAGTLTVEAYDEATLQPVAGATIHVEPGLPTKPPTGRQSAAADAAGRATFTGLGAGSWTITVVHANYGLRTLLACSSAFASLPLRPNAAATATISGTANFVPTPNTRVLVGHNLFDDPAVESVVTGTTTPTAIPTFNVRPGRLGVIGAYAGVFEPTSVSTYSSFALTLAGTNGVTPTPPLAPLAPGQNVSQTLALVPAAGTSVNLAGTYDVDVALAAGLDSANLIGRPTARVVGSLRGVPGMALLGVGFAGAPTGTVHAINATYALSPVVSLAGFAPVLWVSTEARDTSGNVSRQRRLILDPALGTTFPTVELPGVPTIAAPGGASVGAPAVTWEDRLNAALLIGGFGFQELIVTGPGQRRWSILRQDLDGATGSVTVQLPDQLGPAGLAAGDWVVRAENHLLFSFTFANGDYVLEELRRQQVAWSRAAPKTFVVQ
jgi:hypothetical protein